MLYKITKLDTILTVISLILMLVIIPFAPASAHSGVLNVIDPPCLAIPNDGVDDTAAFQRALDDARALAKEVYVPAGVYDFSGHLTVPMGVSLCGAWEGPACKSLGTVLNVTEGAGSETGPAFITLEIVACIKGLVIQYPNQPADAAPPVPYPWTIRSLAVDARIEDVMLIRSYNAIDLGTYEGSRHCVANVTGSPLRRGICVNGSIDVGRMTNVRFDSTGITPGSALDTWKRQNGEAIIIRKADWLWMSQCSITGYNIGISLSAETDPARRVGPPNYIQIADCSIEDVNTPLLVEQCQTLNVTRSSFKGKTSRILSSNIYPVRFSQCVFSPVFGTASLVEASGLGRVSFTSCIFEYWDTLCSLAPALYANCGSLMVKGCEFGMPGGEAFMVGGAPKRQIQLTNNVASAVISGNRMRYGSSILNQSSSNQILLRNNLMDSVGMGPVLISPYGMTISSLYFGMVQGRLVRTWGQVTDSGDGYYCVISDGTLEAKIVSNDQFYLPIGSYIAVTGYCGTDGGPMPIIVPTDIYRHISVYRYAK